MGEKHKADEYKADEHKVENIIIAQPYPMYTAIQCSKCGQYVLGEGKIVDEENYVCVNCRIKEQTKDIITPTDCIIPPIVTPTNCEIVSYPDNNIFNVMLSDIMPPRSNSGPFPSGSDDCPPL